MPEVFSMGLDFGAILKALLPPLIVWVTVACFVTFVGHQPGVICMTPVAWLMACWVGMQCVRISRSERKGTLLTEAAIAGGATGLLQGALFVILSRFMGEIKPEEQQKMLTLSIGILVLGTLVSAGLSVAVGAAQANKRARR
jgi:hypothetical protein